MQANGKCFRTAVLERIIFSVAIVCLPLFPATTGLGAPPIEADRGVSFNVELTAAGPMGEASIREHSIAWHPIKKKYYLVADVIPLKSIQHPNTYNTELHLWSSGDLAKWKYHGVAVKKGTVGFSHDCFGAASPAGMAFYAATFTCRSARGERPVLKNEALGWRFPETILRKFRGQKQRAP